jgi:copper homeostasis protein CutC
LLGASNYLEDSSEKKTELYKSIISYRDVRHKIIHGGSISDSKQQELLKKDNINKLENVLRRSLNKLLTEDVPLPIDSEWVEKFYF